MVAQQYNLLVVGAQARLHHLLLQTRQQSLLVMKPWVLSQPQLKVAVLRRSPLLIQSLQPRSHHLPPPAVLSSAEVQTGARSSVRVGCSLGLTTSSLRTNVYFLRTSTGADHGGGALRQTMRTMMAIRTHIQIAIQIVSRTTALLNVSSGVSSHSW